MTWILLSLASAIFLGVYDVAKKTSVRDNAVPPVLMLNVLTAAAIWGPLVLLNQIYPDFLGGTFVQTNPISLQEHGFLLCKSTLVAASWTFAFIGLKHLPISIATTIRATSPLWTVLIAVTWLGESPNSNQWLGVAIILLAFFVFSRVGKAEGIEFRRNRWVGCMLAATLLGALSALYDKFLLQTVGLEPADVQAWFSIYLVPVMIPITIYWYRHDRNKTPFIWRWSIPGIAVSLLLADYLYFTALTDEQAMISIVSPLRRTSILIPFAVGVLWMSEKNWKAKAMCIVAILGGVILISV